MVSPSAIVWALSASRSDDRPDKKILTVASRRNVFLQDRAPSRHKHSKTIVTYFVLER